MSVDLISAEETDQDPYNLTVDTDLEVDVDDEGRSR